MRPGSDKHDDDALVVAESVRRDFRELLSMLDRQLTNASVMDDRALSHIMEAKVAAERGMQLSIELVDLLKRSEAN